MPRGDRPSRAALGCRAPAAGVPEISIPCPLDGVRVSDVKGSGGADAGAATRS